VYANVARAVLDDRDREAASAQVGRLRARYPRASRDVLARRVIRGAALRCAAAGALWTGPASFFGSPAPGASLGYPVVELNRLVLALAAIYRRPGAVGERAAAAATGLAAGVGAELLHQGIVRILRRAIRRQPAARAFVGAVAGGAIGYSAALAVGRLARNLFRGEGATALLRGLRP
jgi:hypothetical protein